MPLLGIILFYRMADQKPVQFYPPNTIKTVYQILGKCPMGLGSMEIVCWKPSSLSNNLFSVFLSWFCCYGFSRFGIIERIGLFKLINPLQETIIR